MWQSQGASQRFARHALSNLRYGLLKEVPAILKTLAAAAKGGDIQAARLILERTLPALKSAGETLNLPGADTPASQGRTVLGACAQGDITPDEAATLLQAISAQARVVEVEELTQRVQALEQVLTEINVMARLTARILKLERLLPCGLEAALEGLSDDELDAQIAELSGVTVEELRAWTPEEQQRRDDEDLAAVSEADVVDLMRQAPRLFHDLLEEWRELQRKSTASPPLGQRV